MAEVAHAAGCRNLLQQEARFDAFIDCYNHERPHQALEMRYPGELYQPSPRAYRGLRELAYPMHERAATVTQCGRVCFGKRKINVSQEFAGQNVGVKQIADPVWLVGFMHYDLDGSTMRHVAWNRPRTRSRRKCYPCPRYKPSPM